MQVNSISNQKFYSQTNAYSSSKIAFKSGLLPYVAEDINNTNIKETEIFFKQRGIRTDFQNNKVVAGLSKMTADIFESLNLPLPKAIIAFDFSKNKDFANYAGFCTLKSQLINSKLYPSRTTAFSTYSTDSAEQYDYHQKYRKYHNAFSSDHFLNVYVHEFLHSSHMKNISNKHGPLFNILATIKLQNKNFDNWKKMIFLEGGRYSTTNLYELIAEVYTKDIIDSLDIETNMPRYNPFIKGEKDRHEKINDIIKKAWNGYTDF